MKEYNIDLHLHSPYAAGVSKFMSIPLLSKEAKNKGLNILSTADILHSKWEKHVRDNLIKENETFYYKEDKDKKNKTYFILGVEVETKQRVHNLLYFRDFEHLNIFKDKIKRFILNKDKYGGGRPIISLNPEELFELCLDYDVPFGPAHAFTPYFGVYAHYDSLKEAYGKNYKKIKFLELGLSADTLSANTIPELENIKFFSFSDSHSPYSYRIGREFVTVYLEKPNYNSFLDLLNNKNKNRIKLNVGFNPKEGKYNKTACRNCGQTYTLEEAIKNKYKCVLCKGIIKKGVSDKIKEIAIKQGNKELKQIIDRPEYKYLMPLAQIIQIALQKKNILDSAVKEIYNDFIKEDTEIRIMLDVEKSKLEKINKLIAKYIMSFRNNLVVFKAGGAGHYGIPYICFNEEEKLKKIKELEEKNKLKYKQKTLF